MADDGSGPSENTGSEFTVERQNEMNANETKWYVENAGLIITHPFLPHLFKSLAYVNEDQTFKDKSLLSRAVYLLNYIATGENNSTNETALAMPKMLCGIQIQDPIPASLLLMKQEKDMADELLEALISRWEKLGHTSIESLRSTFLRRHGLLEDKDEAYHLTVETSGTDILLDYLPWNIDAVRLPWVKNIMYTSWR